MKEIYQPNRNPLTTNLFFEGIGETETTKDRDRENFEAKYLYSSSNSFFKTREL